MVICFCQSELGAPVLHLPAAEWALVALLLLLEALGLDPGAVAVVHGL